MIQRDYLLRMIQEIVSVIACALLKKQKIGQREWAEYDKLSRQMLGMSTNELLNMEPEELLSRYASQPDGAEKIELAAANMLKMAEEAEGNILLKSKLRQAALQLFKHLQEKGGCYSLQREYLIKLVENNG